MAEYAESIQGPGEKARREKLKKMIDAMEGEKLSHMDNFMMNRIGTYSETGDFDPSDIKYQKDVKSSVKAETADKWGEMLVDQANEQDTEPPRQFFYQGRLYRLNWSEQKKVVKKPVKGAKPSKETKPSKGTTPAKKIESEGTTKVFVDTSPIQF